MAIKLVYMITAVDHAVLMGGQTWWVRGQKQEALKQDPTDPQSREGQATDRPTVPSNLISPAHGSSFSLPHAWMRRSDSALQELVRHVSVHQRRAALEQSTSGRSGRQRNHRAAARTVREGMKQESKR